MNKTVHVYVPKYNPKHEQILRAVAKGIPGAKVLPLGRYQPSDIAVIFGAYKYTFDKTLPKREILEKHKGRRLLMVESGFVKRGELYQVGWGGFAGNADFNLSSQESLDRWESFNVPVHEWRTPGYGKYALVMGQLPRDTQVQDTDHREWCRQVVAHYAAIGQPVKFRPHPRAPDDWFGIPHQYRSEAESLEDALEDTEFVVTYNSTSAVDCVLRGVPVVAVDRGSISWPMASHCYHPGELVRPDRERWLAGLGYSMWGVKEMASGVVWEHLNKGS
jgi:hypothetical protein